MVKPLYFWSPGSHTLILLYLIEFLIQIFLVGFAIAVGGSFVVLETFNSAFGTYDLTTSIGPISGFPAFFQGAPWPTTDGNFIIDSSSGESVFTAVCTPVQTVGPCVAVWTCPGCTTPDSMTVYYPITGQCNPVVAVWPGDNGAIGIVTNGPNQYYNIDAPCATGPCQLHYVMNGGGSPGDCTDSGTNVLNIGQQNMVTDCKGNPQACGYIPGSSVFIDTYYFNADPAGTNSNGTTNSPDCICQTSDPAVPLCTSFATNLPIGVFASPPSIRRSDGTVPPPLLEYNITKPELTLP